MVTSLLLKIRRTGSRQSPPPAESSTSTPQPKGKGRPSRVVPPRPAGHTAPQQQQQQLQRPASLYSSSSQQRSQQNDQKLVRGRIPAVTSTARTTAPESEKERRLRERYPSNFRRGPY